MQPGDVFNMKLNCLTFLLMTGFVVFAHAGNHTQEELEFQNMIAVFDEAAWSDVLVLPEDILGQLSQLVSDVSDGGAEEGSAAVSVPASTTLASVDMTSPQALAAFVETLTALHSMDVEVEIREELEHSKGEAQKNNGKRKEAESEGFDAEISEEEAKKNRKKARNLAAVRRYQEKQSQKSQRSRLQEDFERLQEKHRKMENHYRDTRELLRSVIEQRQSMREVVCPSCQGRSSSY